MSIKPTTFKRLPDYPEWQLRIDPTYRLVGPEHPAVQLVKNTFNAVPLAEAVKLARETGTRNINVPVVYVEDEAEQLARCFAIEPRLQVIGDEYAPEGKPVSPGFTTDFVLVCRPECVEALARGAGFSHVTALVNRPPYHEPVTALHIRTEAKAWEKHLNDMAFEGFEKLFESYSLSEELWRLREWMDKLLPYHLEVDPRLAKYRALLDKQTGHLSKGEADWYENGSPLAGIDEGYKEVTRVSLPERLKWLIEESRARGYKRVAELGSVEGVSLFHLVQHAPDIEWYGFEKSKKAVARGNELAAKVGLAATFRLHQWEKLQWFEPWEPPRATTPPFDATALFEILEHNSPEEGRFLLDQALAVTRPGGTIFVCTPNGNWSGWDRKTRDINIPKDHINAYTPERMMRFLFDWCQARKLAADVRAWPVENPSLCEANGWVNATITLKED